MSRILPAVALAFMAVAACGGEGGEGSAAEAPPPVVRDSAGVRIVENAGVPPTAWRVGDPPVFTVGWEPGGPNFTWPRSGRILPDGGALVGESQQGTIYRLTPDGSVAATWGRQGEGPGEYEALATILVLADSVLVSDDRLRRMTVLSTDGELLSTRPLPGAFLHHVSALLGDGRLLLVPGEGYAGLSETHPEWVFERQPILAADRNGSGVDTLAELPHLRRWYGTRGGSPGPIPVRGRAGGFADGFAWARADMPEVRWYDGSGALEQVARWEEEPVPLTAEWRRRMTGIREETIRSGGADDAFVARQLQELEEGLDRYEGPLPYWRSFHVDRLGNTWLGEYTLFPQPPSRWRVVARDGMFIGWVDLPGAVAILDITDDRVLFVRQDELNVPSVTMLELVKP